MPVPYTIEVKIYEGAHSVPLFAKHISSSNFATLLQVLEAAKASLSSVNAIHCPLCAAPMDIKMGKFGPFWGCTKWSTTKCTGSMNLDNTIPAHVQKQMSKKPKKQKASGDEVLDNLELE